MLNKTTKTAVLAAFVFCVVGCTKQNQELNDNMKLYQSGHASFYGNGEKLSSHTASGQRFNPMGMTAAHRTLNFGQKVKVVSSSGKFIIVTINDRGPFIKGRIIDLSKGSAIKLGIYHKGTDNVKLYLVQ